MQVLKDKPPGEIIIRPSTRGMDHLTVTWKIANDIYRHFDVIEKGKPTPHALGKSLLIGTMEFSDLDEIHDHFVRMTDRVQEVMSERHYYEGSESEVDDKLRRNSASGSQRFIPYCLSLSRKYPGLVLLAYYSSRIHHVYIAAAADGFVLRNRHFSELSQLLSWFKRHAHAPAINPATANAAAAAAMAPVRRPAAAPPTAAEAPMAPLAPLPPYYAQPRMDPFPAAGSYGSSARSSAPLPPPLPPWRR